MQLFHFGIFFSFFLKNHQKSQLATRGAIDDWPEILNQNLPHIPNIHPHFVTKCQNGDFSRKSAKRGALVPSFALFIG